MLLEVRIRLVNKNIYVCDSVLFQLICDGVEIAHKKCYELLNVIFVEAGDRRPTGDYRLL